MSNPAMTLWQHFSNLQGMDQTQVSWPQAWEMVVGLNWEEAAYPLLGLLERTKRTLSSRPSLNLPSLLLHEGEWRRTILLPRISLDAPMNQSGLVLQPAVVTGLYSVAVIIDGFPETSAQAADGQIEKLATAIQGLREDVLNSAELEADLRCFLLDQVNLMQGRIDRHRVTGSGPIEDLVAETIGSSAVNSSLWERAMASSLRTKVVAVFLALQAIANFINAASPAIESTADAVRTTTHVIERVLGDGPPQIEAPNAPHALPAGPTGITPL